MLQSPTADVALSVPFCHQRVVGQWLLGRDDFAFGILPRLEFSSKLSTTASLAHVCLSEPRLCFINEPKEDVRL